MGGNASKTEKEEKFNNTVKMILLGGGESGKTTWIKQMTLFHKNGFSDEDRTMYKRLIAKNMVFSCKEVLNLMNEIPESLEKSREFILAQKLPTAFMDGMDLTKEICENVQILAKN